MKPSRLTQARGLKPDIDRRRAAGYAVAPHAGAWIETETVDQAAAFAGVAPHAGAWIETAPC